MLAALLSWRNVLLSLALFAGICAPKIPQEVAGFVALVVLSVIVIFYLSSLELKKNLQPRSFWTSALVGVLLSYVLLGNVLIWTSATLMFSYGTIWVGFIVLAVVPPIFPEILEFFREKIPITKIIGAYLAGVIIIPFMFGVLVDDALLDTKKIILLGVAVTLLPLSFSRIVFEREKLRKLILANKDAGLNLCFAITLFLAVSVNTDVFLQFPMVLLPIIVTTVISTFILGKLLLKVCSFFQITESTNTVIMGTLKDGFIACGVALYLFPAESSLPAIVYCLNFMLYCAWLEGVFSSPVKR
ncbi:MAG: hypothetical protein K9K75_02270 [Deltaproteobacteria bacterium]|nr:hypothetical protein [Deltaproteobacteria bacterium]